MGGSSVFCALFSIGVVPVSSLLANWFNKRRGTATGTALVGIAAGGLLLAPLLGSITTRFGWKASYIFLGLLVWVVALPVIQFVIKGNPAELGLPPDGDNLGFSVNKAEDHVLASRPWRFWSSSISTA